MILKGETEVLVERYFTAWVVDGCMSMEQWWNYTDRETEVLGERHYSVWVVDIWMSMEQWWNDTDRGN